MHLTPKLAPLVSRCHLSSSAATTTLHSPRMDSLRSFRVASHQKDKDELKADFIYATR